MKGRKIKVWRIIPGLLQHGKQSRRVRRSPFFRKRYATLLLAFCAVVLYVGCSLSYEPACTALKLVTVVI